MIRGSEVGGGVVVIARFFALAVAVSHIRITWVLIKAEEHNPSPNLLRLRLRQRFGGGYKMRVAKVGRALHSYTRHVVLAHRRQPPPVQRNGG